MRSSRIRKGNRSRGCRLGTPGEQEDSARAVVSHPRAIRLREEWGNPAFHVEGGRVTRYRRPIPTPVTAPLGQSHELKYCLEKTSRGPYGAAFFILFSGHVPRSSLRSSWAIFRSSLRDEEFGRSAEPKNGLVR